MKSASCSRRVSILAAHAMLIGWVMTAYGAKDPFQESIEVVTVEVPVQVVAKGRPVRGLDASSFELFADGKRQKITGFEVIDLEASETREAFTDLPLPARRHFLFLFDLSFSQPEGVIRAREAARELVSDGLHPSDLTAVATYSLNHGAELVLGFTPDRTQLDAALDRLGLQQFADRLIDPLSLMVDIDPVVRASNELAPGGTGFDDLARQHFADLAVATQRVTRELQIDRAQKYSASMEDMATVLREVRGRKQVVLFSEGFDTSTILGTDSRQRIAEAAQAVSRGEYWKVDSDERFGSGSTLSFLERMLVTFRTADAVIQAVDVGGARVASRGEVGIGTVGTASVTGSSEGFRSLTENSLFVMANETGGELYRNFNDLNQAMGQLLDRSSVTYLLSFEPKKLPSDGAFHRLNVKLKNAPRGTRAVHKPGFFAPTPFRDQSELIRQLRAADLVLDASDGGDFETQVWVTPGASVRTVDGGDDGDDNGRDALRKVHVSLEIDSERLLALQEFDLAKFRVFIYATRQDGTIVDFMTQAVDVDLDRVEDDIALGGLGFFGELHLPAGSFRIRTVFQDARTGRYSTRTTRLRLPSDVPRVVTVTPPLFARSTGQGLLLLENDSRRALGRYPFLDTPTSIPWVPRSQVRVDPARPAPLELAVFARASAGATLDAWLEGEGGARLEVPLTVLRPLEENADGWLQARLAVDPRALQPATYRVRVELRDGERRASSAGTLVIGDG